MIGTLLVCATLLAVDGDTIRGGASYGRRPSAGAHSNCPSQLLVCPLSSITYQRWGMGVLGQ